MSWPQLRAYPRSITSLHLVSDPRYNYLFDALGTSLKNKAAELAPCNKWQIRFKFNQIKFKLYGLAELEISFENLVSNS